MRAIVSPKQVRNSELYKLVKDGVLDINKPVHANLPSGRNIGVKMNDDGTITKAIRNKKGDFIKSEFEVTENGTRLKSIYQETPNGAIEQVYLKDGDVGGHVWTHEPWGIIWGYDGNIRNPISASSCIHKPPFKNDKSIDAFKAAVDYIKGNGSIDAYNAQMLK